MLEHLSWLIENTPETEFNHHSIWVGLKHIDAIDPKDGEFSIEAECKQHAKVRSTWLFCTITTSPLTDPGIY